MNKNDIKLILLLILLLIGFFTFKKISNFEEKIAKIYYNDMIIETISLSNDGFYKVKVYNGDVVMEVKDNKIRVVEEISERNLCSKQGFEDVIICLPNKIVVKVESSDSELDGVVK